MPPASKKEAANTAKPVHNRTIKIPVTKKRTLPPKPQIKQGTDFFNIFIYKNLHHAPHEMTFHLYPMHRTVRIIFGSPG